MERFLAMNEQVMSAYLGGGAAVALEQARRPLVGTVVAWEPELELVARRLVDPAEDRYLLDHTLGRTVSRSDPGLHALALMPLAMSIEIIAEAASCLLPELTVTGLRDLRAHRWLAFARARRRSRSRSGASPPRTAASGCASSCVTSATALRRPTRWSRRRCCSRTASRSRRPRR